MYRIKSLATAIFLVTVVCLPAIGQNLKSIQKTLQKDHYKFRRGHYEAVKKDCEKLTAELDGKVGRESSDFSAQSHFLLARTIVQFESKDATNIQAQIDNALGVLQKVHGSKSKPYAIGLITSADIYIQYTDFINAKKYLDEAYDVSDKIGQDADLIHEIERIHAKWLMGTGYYKEAYEMSEGLMKHMTKYLSRMQTIFDPKTATNKPHKLKKGDWIEKKRSYADHLHLMCDILIEEGRLASAKKKLDETQIWVIEHLGKKDISYIDNLILEAKLHDRFDNLKHSIQTMQKALDKNSGISNKKRYQPTSSERLKMLEFHIVNKWSHGGKDNRTEANSLRDKYYSDIKTTFGRKSARVAKIERLDAIKKMLAVDNANEKERGLAKAEKLIDDLLANTEVLPATHPYRIGVLKTAIDIYSEQGNINKTSDASIELIEMYTQFFPKDCPVHHRERINRAIISFRFGNEFDSAEKTFEESFDEVFVKTVYPLHPDYFKFGNARTELLVITDQFDKAVSSAEKLLNKSEELYKRPNITGWQYADQLIHMLDLYTVTGDYKKALGIKQQVEIILDENDENRIHKKKIMLKLDRALAALYMTWADYSNTEKYLRDYQREANVDRFNKRDLVKFAPYYIISKRAESAEKALSEYRGKLEDFYGFNDRRLIPILNNLAIINLDNGIMQAADSLVAKSIYIAQTVHGKSSLIYANTLTVSGDVHMAIGDYEKARQEYAQSLKTLRALFGEEHILIALNISNLAMAKMYDGDLSTNIKDELTLAASQIRKLLSDDNTHYAEILTNLAFYYLKVGKTSLAMTYIEKAKECWKSDGKVLKNRVKIADLDLLEGRVLQEEGNYSAAIGSYRASKNVYMTEYGNQHPKYIRSQSKIAESLYLKGQINSAVDYLNITTQAYIEFINQNFPYLSEREKAQYWKSIGNDFEFYNTLAFTQMKNNFIENVYDYRLNTKAILLTSSVKVRESILSSQDSALIAKYSVWVQKKEDFTSSLSMSIEELKENGINLDNLENEIKIIEKELSTESNVFKKDLSKKDLYKWKDVKNALGENEYAIEIIKYRYFANTFTDSIIYVALVIGKDIKRPQPVILANGAEMDHKYLKYYRNATKFKIDDEFSYSVFWKDIDAIIDDGAKVYISADGVYNQLNIEALKDDDGKYVLDKNEIVLISNTKDIAEKRAKENSKDGIVLNTTKSALLIGNPAFYEANLNQASHSNTSGRQSIKQLPGAEDEINGVYALLTGKSWDTQKLIYENATEDTLKKIKNPSPRIFHIATHGFFNQDNVKKVDITQEFDNRIAIDNPLLKSGLLLRDAGDIVDNSNVHNYNASSGVLTAAEAMNLYLDNTELVILSACETGRGDVETGEGVYGLQRAFIVAGAQSVIMSLFKVSDEVTNKLMNEFYKNWLDSGNKRKAFIAAKKTIRSEYKDPIYWGVFVMVGMD